MASSASSILAELKQMFGNLPMDASALAAGMPATDGIPTTVSDLKELWKRIEGPVAIYEFYGHNEETWGPSAPLRWPMSSTSGSWTSWLSFLAVQSALRP